MQKKTSRKFFISIEHASILRKFTELFFLVSIVPLVILAYFYIQIAYGKGFQIGEKDFFWILSFVVIGIAVGYIAMRSVLKKLIDVTDESKKALETVLPASDMEEIKGETNEIAVLAQTFSAVTKRLEENVRSLELTKKTLHSVMSKIGHGISNMQNIDSFLELILETVTEALNGRIGVLMLLDKDGNNLSVKVIYGADYPKDKQIEIKVEEAAIMNSIIQSKKPIVIPRINSEKQNVGEYSHLFESPLVCTPLIIQDSVKGVLSVSGRRDEKNFSDDDMSLLLNLASQTAVAIENSKLSEDIESTYFETISALALAVDAKDQYSRGHLDRVAGHCMQIGKKLGLSESDLKILSDAARLHDLGKIGIPDEVLCKQGPLTDEEWILMRKHPEIGEGIIKPIRSLNHLCDIIRHHHEKLDGTGYPDGLKGEEITLLVRITTVADIYDAVTTDRPYRKRMPKETACQLLLKMDKELDQDIVKQFVEVVNGE